MKQPSDDLHSYAPDQIRTVYFYCFEEQEKPKQQAINLSFEPAEAFLVESLRIETDFTELSNITVELLSAGYGKSLCEFAAAPLNTEHFHPLETPAFCAPNDTLQVRIKSPDGIPTGEFQVHLKGTIARRRPHPRT